MSVTFQEMMDFVRAHADADEIDAPNGSMLVYARMAYNEILARRTTWPHLEVSYTLNVTIGEDTYPLSELTGGSDLTTVSSVIDPTGHGRRLPFVTQTDADLIYGSNSSSPAHSYTVSGGNIILHPTPSAGYTYTVRGFRDATPWPVGVGSVPDLPDPLHDAISWFMLSSYYMAQEDPDLAGAYLREYDNIVDRFVIADQRKTMAARPTIMGGQNANPRSFLDRVRGSLE